MTVSGTPEWVGRRSRERKARVAADLLHDDQEVELLITAAQRILRRGGVEAVTVREVLAATSFGTRAFYRHFASRDELVMAVFVRAARREADRLTQKMARAGGPLEAVVAWIDGRLDLAFDRRVASSARELSVEAQLRRRQTPAELELAVELMLAPLIEQLEAALSVGLLQGVDPLRDARSVHDVVWGVIERQWSGFAMRPQETRRHVVRFCLRALGASQHEVSARDASRG